MERCVPPPGLSGESLILKEAAAVFGKSTHKNKGI